MDTFIPVISLTLSVLTALAALWVFIVYDRRLKKQQKSINELNQTLLSQQIELNNHALNKVNQEQIDTKKAKPYAVFQRRGSGKGGEIIITNRGASPAKNLRVEVSPSRSVIIPSNRNITLGDMQPGDKHKIVVHLTNGPKHAVEITYYWDDEYQSGRKLVQKVNI